MIKRKEDLHDTYIKNDFGELRQLYVSACAKFGINKFDDEVGDEAILECFSSNCGLTDPYELCDEYSTPEDSSRELTLSDLQPIPQQEAKMNIDKLATQVEEVEWKNGDVCIYKGEECLFIGELPVKCAAIRADCIIQHKAGAPLPVDLCDLSKPESPEEKQKRETVDKICWDVKSIKLSQAIALYEAGYRLND